MRTNPSEFIKNYIYKLIAEKKPIGYKAVIDYLKDKNLLVVKDTVVKKYASRTKNILLKKGLIEETYIGRQKYVLFKDPNQHYVSSEDIEALATEVYQEFKDIDNSRDRSNYRAKKKAKDGKNTYRNKISGRSSEIPPWLIVIDEEHISIEHEGVLVSMIAVGRKAKIELSERAVIVLD